MQNHVPILLANLKKPFSTWLALRSSTEALVGSFGG